MVWKNWQVALVAVLFGFVVLTNVRAEKAKEKDQGKAEDFKGKTFDLKEKGSASITLTFPANKKATVTVKSEKKSDVNLYVYNGKQEIAKDESPGPDCEVTFTPGAALKLTLRVVNKGPGDNKSTLKVALAK